MTRKTQEVGTDKTIDIIKDFALHFGLQFTGELTFETNEDRKQEYILGGEGGSYFFTIYIKYLNNKPPFTLYKVIHLFVRFIHSVY